MLSSQIVISRSLALELLLVVVQHLLEVSLEYELLLAGIWWARCPSKWTLGKAIEQTIPDLPPLGQRFYLWSSTRPLWKVESERVKLEMFWRTLYWRLSGVVSRDTCYHLATRGEISPNVKRWGWFGCCRRLGWNMSNYDWFVCPTVHIVERNKRQQVTVHLCPVPGRLINGSPRFEQGILDELAEFWTISYPDSKQCPAWRVAKLADWQFSQLPVW